MAESFWVIPKYDDIRTPNSILLEQANTLKDATQGLLLGVVQGGQSGNAIAYTFDIVVPTLNNYKFRLLAISHGMTLYPVNLSWALGNMTLHCADATAFETALKQKLSGSDTQKLLAGLLAQVRAE